MPLSLHSRYYELTPLELDDRVGLEQRLVEVHAPIKGSLLHTLTGAETLDQLARRYYGREDLWWRIADANPRRAPWEWEPGDVLVVPPLSAATRTPGR